MGAELGLTHNEMRCGEVYEKALDDEVNKPVVDLLNEMRQHAR